MLTHIVLFTPRADIDAEGRRGLADALSAALAKITSIRRCRVGRRVTFGFGYEAAVPEDYRYVAIIEFDDAAGLTAYLQHPAHEELARQFYGTVAANLACDYDLLEGTAGVNALLAG
jgi:hypothetical protein